MERMKLVVVGAVVGLLVGLAGPAVTQTATTLEERVTFLEEWRIGMMEAARFIKEDVGEHRALLLRVCRKLDMQRCDI